MRCRIWEGQTFQRLIGILLQVDLLAEERPALAAVCPHLSIVAEAPQRLGPVQASVMVDSETLGVSRSVSC